MAVPGEKQGDLLDGSNCHSKDRGRCLRLGGSSGVCKQRSDKGYIFKLESKRFVDKLFIRESSQE